MERLYKIENPDYAESKVLQRAELPDMPDIPDPRVTLEKFPLRVELPDMPDIPDPRVTPEKISLRAELPDMPDIADPRDGEGDIQLPKDIPKLSPPLGNGDVFGKLQSQRNDAGDTQKTRDLTLEERVYYKEKLGWTDKQLDNCTIDEDGKLHLETINSDKEGTTDDNGVPYKRKTIEINGIEIEGVFPEFSSALDVQLPKELEGADNKKQFDECNKKLKEAVDNDPEFANQFTDKQLEDIENGKTPKGYTWHHNEEQGKIQLVKSSEHNSALGGSAHTGGQVIWGGGQSNR